MRHLEDRVLNWLQRRQNTRRFGVPMVNYQDCMDLMFVLAQRLTRLEKIFSPEAIRKIIADDIRSGGRLREVVKNA